MPDNLMQAHLGFILVLMTLYFGHMVTAQTTTNTLTLAQEWTNACRSMENKPGYDNCLEFVLEPIVWSLIDRQELDLNKCTVDKTVGNRAWCSEWGYLWWKRSILISNERLVEYIAAPASNKPSIPKQGGKPIRTTTKQEPITQMTVPSISEYAKIRVNQKRDEVMGSVNNIVEKVDDVKQEIAKEAKLKVDRVTKLGDEIKERAVKTAKYVTTSMQDLGENVKNTWSKPL